MKSRTEAEETVDLGLLVPGIEIQVKPILIQVTFGREIQREVGTSTFGVLEDDPSSVRGILGNVVERLFPQSHHPEESSQSMTMEPILTVPPRSTRPAENSRPR